MLDWMFPALEWEQRGLRASVFLVLFAFVLVGVPLLLGVEPTL